MLYSIAKTLVLPPTSLFILLLCCLLLARWKRRLGHAFLWSLLAVVYLTTTPFIAGELMAPLQPYPPVDLQHPDDEAGAIVVLGAGVYLAAPEYRSPAAGAAVGLSGDSLTMQRIQYAAFLAKATGKPILVSGGPSGSSRQHTVAEAMKAALLNDFGVAARWSEEESESTLSNARLAAIKLRENGIRRFYLVTHAWHMPRAMTSFAGLDVEPVPAPTRFVSRSELRWRDFLPSARAFCTTYYAVHEWLGLAWYRLRH